MKNINCLSISYNAGLTVPQGIRIIEETVVYVKPQGVTHQVIIALVRVRIELMRDIVSLQLLFHLPPEL